MAAVAKFKAGDLVVLKSGGPKMVFIRETNNGEVACLYYDAGRGDVVRVTLAREAIKRARK